MTTSPETPRTNYVGDGSTATFATDFTFALAVEVRVTVQPSGDDSATTQALGVDYDLSGVAADWISGGANVVFRTGVIPGIDAAVRITRATAIDQPEDFGDDQGFSPKQMERTADRLTRIAQEIAQGFSDGEGPEGPAGAQGNKGWSPVFAVVSDGARRVLQVTSWTGGEGDAPASPTYVGASGFTTVLASAVDIRGATGTTGAAGADAPQIADTSTNSTNPWSSSKIVAYVASTISAAIGVTVQAYSALLTAIAALGANGLIARTASGAAAARTLTAPAAGLTITDGDGVSGNPTFALANDLAALEGLAGTGLYYRSASDTWTLVTIGTNLTFSGGTLSAAGAAGSGGLLAANNLSDVANASTARTNLGVAIGSNVQAYNANLTTFAGIAPSANVQTLLGAADYAAFRTSLSLVVGTDVQAYNAKLAAIAGLTLAADKFIYWSGASTAVAGDFTSVARTLVAQTTQALMRSTGLGLGTIATFDETTAAQYQANTAGKALSTDKVWSAADLVTLTDAATVAIDMSTFINAVVTLAGNRTLGAPSNTKNGQSGVIKIVQDGTGSRTLAYNSAWKFAGGTAPVLTTTASAIDLLFYQVIDSTHIYATLVKDVK